ncbi:hypothetical protein PRIPAC_83288, partial [Pristionchus pacificus]|uniref:Uncharacterized protein n=1 Tax=Pristionchus pacificus TaxID=54126 RepID=A0A2A6BMZ7_PRIPA
QEWKRKVEKEPHQMDEMDENERTSVRFATRQQLIELRQCMQIEYLRFGLRNDDICNLRMEPHQYQQEWKRKVEKEPHPMDEMEENEERSVRFATRQQRIEQEWKRKVEKEPHPMDEMEENEERSVRFATRQQRIEQEWKRKVEKEPHPMDEMEENEERSVRFATRQQRIEVTVTEDRCYSREPHQYQQEWKRKVEKEPHPMNEMEENEERSVRFATRQQLIELRQCMQIDDEN